MVRIIKILPPGFLCFPLNMVRRDFGIVPQPFLDSERYVILTGTVSVPENSVEWLERFNGTPEWGWAAHGVIKTAGAMDSVAIQLVAHWRRQTGHTGKFQWYTHMPSSWELEIHHCYLFPKSTSQPVSNTMGSHSRHNPLKLWILHGAEKAALVSLSLP